MFWTRPHTLLAKPHEQHFATPWESTNNTIKYKSKTKKNQKNPWCKKKHKIKNNNNVKTTQENKKTIAIMLQWKKLEASSEQS